jgi:hypothetical protein
MEGVSKRKLMMVWGGGNRISLRASIVCFLFSFVSNGHKARDVFRINFRAPSPPPPQGGPIKRNLFSASNRAPRAAPSLYSLSNYSPSPSLITYIRTRCFIQFENSNKRLGAFIYFFICLLFLSSPLIKIQLGAYKVMWHLLFALNPPARKKWSKASSKFYF